MRVTSPMSESVFLPEGIFFTGFPCWEALPKSFCSVQLHDNFNIDMHYLFKLYRLHILVICYWNISCGNQYKCSVVSDCWMESLLKCLTTHVHKEMLYRLAKPTFLLKVSALLAPHFQFHFTADAVCTAMKIQALQKLCPLAPKHGALSFLRLAFLCGINRGVLHIHL